MTLIYDYGFNCHLACVASIAVALERDYTKAFFNLWSEQDFFCNQLHAIYESRRVKDNLKQVGIQLHPIKCTAPEEGRTALAQVETGGFFVVGMDDYWIPWHPVYRHFHGLHYFFAQKTTGAIFPCGDPVYGQEYAAMAVKEIEDHAFEVIPVTKVPTPAPPPPLWEEAEAIIRQYPDFALQLEAEIRDCSGKKAVAIRPLIGRMNAMLNNRRLFQKYLYHSSEIPQGHEHFFTKAFLSRWEAAKNGLYKAALAKDNRPILDEVVNRFSALLAEEMTMATEIAALKG